MKSFLLSFVLCAVSLSTHAADTAASVFARDIRPLLDRYCADCHDAARSKLATDVSMPSIETCRDCHGGSRPVEGKVTSNCLLCHGFHDSRHPWDPGFVPKGSRIASASGDAH